MNRTEYETHIAEFLYGEIEDTDRLLIEKWWEEHPQHRKEFEELKQTAEALSALNSPEPSLSKTIVLDIGSLQKAKKPQWRRWAVAAAACIFALFCVSQGFVLQVGGMRIALGNAAPEENVSDSIRDHWNSDYLPIMNQMAEAVDNLAVGNQRLIEKQDALEESIYIIRALQKQAQSLNDQQMQAFASELMSEIDQRLRNQIIASSYKPASITNE